MWEKIIDIYFGTPYKAFVFVMLFIGLPVGALGYRFYQFRFLEYELRLEETTNEVQALKNIIATRAQERLTANFTFKELTFEETIEHEKEKQVRRLLDYGKFALGKNDFDYAQSLFSEANSMSETAEADYYVGIIAYLSGRYDEAVRLWRKVLVAGDTNLTRSIRVYILLAAYAAEDKETIDEFTLPSGFPNHPLGYGTFGPLRPLR